jgi:hypothetical protein
VKPLGMLKLFSEGSAPHFYGINPYSRIIIIKIVELF